MQQDVVFDQWLAAFPALADMASSDRHLARHAIRFPQLGEGEVAYRQGWACPNYVMCIDGRTRVFKTSAQGREMLVYRVGAGGTCVLTTQCLLAGGSFPAESVAEAPTQLAAIPADLFRTLMTQSPVFRGFVLNDYSRLLGQLFSLIDEVAFTSLEQRLARRLLAEADSGGIVSTTHQQLALDLGSVREVISRYLGDWERRGWIRTARGSIVIMSREALAAHPREL